MQMHIDSKESPQRSAYTTKHIASSTSFPKGNINTSEHVNICSLSCKTMQLSIQIHVFFFKDYTINHFQCSLTQHDISPTYKHVYS